MGKFYSYSEMARICGRPARCVSDAIRYGKLDPTRWPMLGGRRLIPESDLEMVRQALATDRRYRESREPLACAV